MSNKIAKTSGLIAIGLLALSVGLDHIEVISKPQASLILNIGLLFFAVASFMVANGKLKPKGVRNKR